MTHYNNLIVGQGLAGSLLSWRLVQTGQSVMVIDNDNPCAASRVAAGLMNPVTGKRLVKDPMVESYLAAARECYAELGAQFGQVYLHEKPMLRLFDNEEIKQAWRKRRAEPGYEDFIGEELGPAECGYPQGGFLQYQTAYLSVTSLLNAIRQWLIDHSAMITTEFDYRELNISKLVSWRDLSADRLIFCEGARVTENPWFNTLPMQATQGEILTGRSNDRLPQWIINGGQWLLPLDDGLFKLGATYVWPTADKPLAEEISKDGKTTLLNALPRLCPSLHDYEIISHDVGIRPNSRDKRPYIGFHPKHPCLAAFNGFGSRGSLLIPYYSQHFVDVLLNKTSLKPDVDIKRVMA